MSIIKGRIAVSRAKMTYLKSVLAPTGYSKHLARYTLNFLAKLLIDYSLH